MIYKGSRFKRSFKFYDAVNAIVYLGRPKHLFNPTTGDYSIPFTEGMRVDTLAKKYYNDSQLDWVIMQANPQYATPEDIPPGDIIVIPDPKRVMHNV